MVKVILKDASTIGSSSQMSQCYVPVRSCIEIEAPAWNRPQKEQHRLWCHRNKE